MANASNWFCNKCKDTDGGKCKNFGFRDKCMLCGRKKGVAHGGAASPGAPSVSKKKVPKNTKKEESSGDEGESDSLARRVEELEEENARLRDKVENECLATPSGDGSGSEDESGGEPKDFRVRAEDYAAMRKALLDGGCPQGH